MGHRLTEIAGINAGYGRWALNQVSFEICKEAARRLGRSSVARMCDEISGYAKDSWAEAVAEAFSDVYCNRNSARAASGMIVNVLNSYFNGKGI